MSPGSLNRCRPARVAESSQIPCFCAHFTRTLRCGPAFLQHVPGEANCASSKCNFSRGLGSRRLAALLALSRGPKRGWEQSRGGNRPALACGVGGTLSCGREPTSTDLDVDLAQRVLGRTLKLDSFDPGRQGGRKGPLELRGRAAHPVRRTAPTLRGTAETRRSAWLSRF